MRPVLRDPTATHEPSRNLARARTDDGQPRAAWRGFARHFTCEDIELTFRRPELYLREGREYKILSLPHTVGVTEGPDRMRSLIAQRERWQRVILLAPLERVLYRPALVWARLLGTVRFLRGDRQWHKFERNSRPRQATEPAAG